MQPPAGPTHTQNTPSQQFRGRDSRVVSIYDKYLYDPKDLESSDPRRRELARKASRMRLQGKAANVHEANGQNPPQRKSIAFAQGTKTRDRPQDGPAPDRDSGAWGLGMGMLDDNASGSDSDSEDGHRPPPRSAPVQQTDNRFADQQSSRSASAERGSWSERAAAVGQRPPDNASQNPPSLKLMGLKSAKNGGSIPPAPPQQTLDSSYGTDSERQRRIPSTSDYGDNTSRHGSTINFGAGHDSLDSSGAPGQQRLQQPANANTSDSQNRRPISPKTELTRQLGLVTPNAPPPGHPQQGDYFQGATHGQGVAPAPGNFSGPSPPRSAGPTNPFDNPHNPPPPQHGGRAPSPMAPPRSPGFAPGPAGPFPRGAQGGMPPNGRMPSPGMAPPSPYGPPGSMPRGPSPQPMAPPNVPPNVLQRGPQPGPHPQQQMLSPSGGPVRYANGQGPPSPGHGPMPMRGPSPGPGPMRGPPPGPGPMRGPQPTGPAGPMGPNGFAGGPQPPQQRNMGPGFSDSPGPQKRQSIFRRSMAFFNGAPGPGSQGPAGQHGPPGGAPAGKRQSLFRRSMAFLGGNGGPPRAQPPPPADPVPRVKGFEDDTEKPDHSRKSQFLGAGGAGFEWDAQGQGAKFWRRFSVAQKTAHTQKMEEGSKAWHETMAVGKRKLIVLTVISLTILVGTIVGIIVWREMVSPSGNKDSGQPGSLYHGNFGDGTTPSSTVSGALDRRMAMPTGLAKRVTYSGEDGDRGDDEVSALQNVSSPVELSLDAPRNLPMRHRRRRSKAASRAAAPQSGSLADID
ncbi:uncharacterized protein PFL1_03624 [Pseudozyma flocculosa PF-1]|uniref:Uncharacterized protein n=2 Tax=Pseudozyma flocculosa TaxID=84751 RepID=A0A5C3F7L1_9BASI|nr:uncharacterized protein PFL1_03624 [Pseudozyma flocculosa PF-1]EPQ28821.1 hypothetical protein PFL1_03624 [Pseudozyma flocculosa PF-1]SPO39389.1 uncharacterized protein PSFLO_04870 [Pseudozyma flocculosa]